MAAAARPERLPDGWWREGVAGVDKLFEVSREGDTVRTRLGELGVDSG